MEAFPHHGELRADLEFPHSTFERHPGFRRFSLDFLMRLTPLSIEDWSQNTPGTSFSRFFSGWRRLQCKRQSTAERLSPSPSNRRESSFALMRSS
jgi:hypothetical protein